MTEISNMERYNNERQELAEKRKQHVLEVAEKVILDKGLGMTTMSDIMKAANVSKATLYRYYESMDAIAFEIEYKMLDRIMPNTYTVDEHPESFREATYNVALKLIDDFHDNEDAYCFISMFDNHYSKSYPTEQLSNDYQKFLHRYDWYEGEAIGEEEKVRAMTQMNMLLSFLQRLARRGKQLELNQGITVNAQLAVLRKMMEREQKYE